MNPFRRLQSWVWNKIQPEWDEPEPDVTTPLVIADYIASRRHPVECRGGCQCDPEEVRRHEWKRVEEP